MFSKLVRTLADVFGLAAGIQISGAALVRNLESTEECDKMLLLSEDGEVCR